MNDEMQETQPVSRQPAAQLTLPLPGAASSGRELTLSRQRAVVPASLATERFSIESRYAAFLEENLALGRLVSYVGNRAAPLLRLYRYKEAFSLVLVNHFLDRFNATARDMVFDPFAGMGTTLFAAMSRGIPSLGTERLPVAAFIADIWRKFYEIEPGALSAALGRLAACIDTFPPAPFASDVPVVRLAFREEILTRLLQWKAAVATLEASVRDVLQFLLLSIVEPTSHASNDGQFLRLKQDKRPPWPDDALRGKVLQAEEDIAKIRGPLADHTHLAPPAVHLADTRDLSHLSIGQQPTILITSPPYPNRYDYTRSYALELCLLFVDSFRQLRDLRQSILRSHIESKALPGDEAPHPVVAEVIENLAQRKLNNPRIPIMLVGYFVDMEKSIRQWSALAAPGARVALVVDNVRFAGEMVPVDLLLCDLAEKHGFTVERVIVARYKGNSSQQMGRYGRSPVRESIVLWSKR